MSKQTIILKPNVRRFTWLLVWLLLSFPVVQLAHNHIPASAVNSERSKEMLRTAIVKCSFCDFFSTTQGKALVLICSPNSGILLSEPIESCIAVILKRINFYPQQLTNKAPPIFI